MTRTLSLALAPSQSWCRDVSLQFPEAEIRILKALPTGDGKMIELLEVRTEFNRPVREFLQNHAEVLHLQVVEEGPQRLLIRIQVNLCPVMESLQSSGLLASEPQRLDAGKEMIELSGERGELTDLVRSLEANGTTYQLKSARRTRPNGLLTERQREVLAAAVQNGFYDFPRRINLTRLAEKTDLAKSTLSQMLSLIESKLVHDIWGRIGGPNLLNCR